MKLKLQFDKQTVLEFLLLNGEKIVAGIVVFGALLILYSAWMRVKSFERTPEELQQAALRGQQELDKTRSDFGLNVPDFVKLAKQSRVPIEEKPYSLPNVWNKPLFVLKQVRGEPELFALTDLRGTGEVGGFRKPVSRTSDFRTERPGARPLGSKSGTDAKKSAKSDTGSMYRPGVPTPPEDNIGKHWIVLTGLVPLEKQDAAYVEAFKQSVYYNRTMDIPVYLGYWVERVEVTSPGDAAAPNWEKAKKFMSKETVDAALTEWGLSTGVEVVSRDFGDQRLTFPLGPLVSRSWGESVAHPPEIPLISEGLKTDEARRRDEAEMQNMQEVQQRQRMMESERLGGGREGLSGFLDDSIFGTPTTENDWSLDQTRFGFREQIVLPPYKLFRFFDFNVEPGKQYVYRVRLALYNPNRRLRTSILKSPDLAEKQFLETKWSDPSPPIAVPLDSNVLLASVKPAARITAEPSASVLVTQWVQGKGIEAFKDFPLTRGRTANFPDESFRPPRPRINVDPLVARTRYAPFPVDFLSEATAVDLRGGERLGRRGSTLTAVGEMLLLRSDGTLDVHNELDDATAYQRITNPPPEVLAPGAMGGEGMQEGISEEGRGDPGRGGRR